MEIRNLTLERPRFFLKTDIFVFKKFKFQTSIYPEKNDLNPGFNFLVRESS